MIVPTTTQYFAAGHEIPSSSGPTESAGCGPRGGFGATLQELPSKDSTIGADPSFPMEKQLLDPGHETDKSDDEDGDAATAVPEPGPIVSKPPIANRTPKLERPREISIVLRPPLFDKGHFAIRVNHEVDCASKRSGVEMSPVVKRSLDPKLHHRHLRWTGDAVGSEQVLLLS
jgi:hypothetical protein